MNNKANNTSKTKTLKEVKASNGIKHFTPILKPWYDDTQNEINASDNLNKSNYQSNNVVKESQNYDENLTQNWNNKIITNNQNWNNKIITNNQNQLKEVDIESVNVDLATNNKAKISVINNPNAFFLTNTISEFEEKALNPIDDTGNINSSELREEIIILREQSYIKEQEEKDKLLQKLSINVPKNPAVGSKKNIEQKPVMILANEFENEFEDISGDKTLSKTNEGQKIQKAQKAQKVIASKMKGDKTENRFLNFRTIQEKNVNFKDAKESLEKTMDNLIYNVNHKKIKGKKENEKSIYEEYADSVDNTIKHDNDLLKNKRPNLNIPVVNNMDLTNANTIDDLDKVISSAKNKNKTSDIDILKLNNDTTMMVDKILSKAHNVDELRRMYENSKFDDFEYWFQNSKEVKKLRKQTLKEEKKLQKENKRLEKLEGKNTSDSDE